MSSILSGSWRRFSMLTVTSIVLAILSTVAQRFVDSYTAVHQLGVLQHDEWSFLACLPGFPVVVFVPIWIYRKAKGRL